MYIYRLYVHLSDMRVFYNRIKTFLIWYHSYSSSLFRFHGDLGFSSFDWAMMSASYCQLFILFISDLLITVFETSLFLIMFAIQFLWSFLVCSSWLLVFLIHWSSLQSFYMASPANNRSSAEFVDCASSGRSIWESVLPP